MLKRKEIRKRRIAEWSVPWEVVDNEPELMMMLHRDVLVVKAECDYASRSIRYVGFSSDFPLGPNHVMPPTVDWTVDDHGPRFVCDA